MAVIASTASINFINKAVCGNLIESLSIGNSIYEIATVHETKTSLAMTENL